VRRAMIEDECKHGLAPAWCSVCIHGVSKPELVTVEFTIKAKHDGSCPSCNLPISAGEHISKLSNERYVHEWCAL
jgi:hypothetical protein